MSIGTLSAEDQSKLRRVLDTGVATTQEIADLKEGLRETVKAIADELSIKPADINRAIKAAFKNSFENDKETVDNVEEILAIAGRR